MNLERKNSLSYAQTGIDRNIRQKSQKGIQEALSTSARRYKLGRPIELPFGRIFPVSKESPQYYDQQIEGVGTKTLLAELIGKYDTIGMDAVAMAVNDVLRSGAQPLLLSDALHISKSNPTVVRAILEGISEGVKESGCILASGETGDVGEILHNPIAPTGLPFDLLVSCLGIVGKKQIIDGHISEGDHVIGLESSGIHSNGLTLARKVLLKRWGGIYEPYEQPGNLHHTLISELLEPTRIYAHALELLRKNEVKVKAAIHITGDGIAKFRRLLKFQRRSNLGFNLNLQKEPREIFTLIAQSAKQTGTPISIAEMFRTFNMGVGFAIVLSPEDSSRAIDILNNEYGAENIGSVTSNGKIRVQSHYSHGMIQL